MTFKEKLFELLKIYPNFKNTLKAITEQIPEEKFKLLTVNSYGQKYTFQGYMEFHYGHMYSIHSLRKIKEKFKVIIDRYKRLKINKQFNIDKLEKFEITHFQYVLLEQ